VSLLVLTYTHKKVEIWEGKKKEQLKYSHGSVENEKRQPSARKKKNLRKQLWINVMAFSRKRMSKVQQI
jgi:hypothetical protein